MVAQNEYLIIDSYLLKLHKKISPQASRSISLDPREFPVELIQREAYIWNEFLCIIKETFHSTYEIDNKSFVIHPKHVDMNNNKDIQAELKQALEYFREVNFTTQEVQKTKVPQAWTNVIERLRELASRDVLLILRETPLSIEFYGLRKDVDETAKHIAQLVDQHEMKKLELDHLQMWQIEYLRKFESDFKLDRCMLSFPSDKKVIIFGPNNAVEQSLDVLKQFVPTLRQDKLEVKDQRLLAYFSIESNLNKLRRIVENNNLRLIVTLCMHTVCMIYADFTQKARCVELVKRLFDGHVFNIDDPNVLKIVTNNKRFEESLRTQLKMSPQELNETVFFENENTLVVVGEANLVQRCTEFINNFINNNTVNSRANFFEEISFKD